MDISALPARIASKIRIDPDDHWVWVGHVNRDGYGRVRLDGRKRNAHCATYELLVGPIPDATVVDHVCRKRACVNPSHLQPLTNRENLRRGTGIAAAGIQARDAGVCLHGHVLAVVGLHSDGKGGFACGQCRRNRRREARLRAA